ncbi:MAG: thioredoxin family protein [Candidatus Babeliales bacterium]
MTLSRTMIIGALVAALYLICAYVAQLGTVPLHIRYALSGCLFGFWPVLFLILLLYAIYSAWKTRQRDSILLAITSLFMTLWLAPAMLRISYYSFQAAMASSSAHPGIQARRATADTAKEPAKHETAAAPATIEEVTSEKQLNALIAASTQQPLVVKIFATWCGPCQQMVPSYKAVAAGLQDKITFTEINFDVFDNKDALNVRGLPTIICYKNGSEAFRIGGYRTKDQLNQEISKLL